MANQHSFRCRSGEPVAIRDVSDLPDPIAELKPALEAVQREYRYAWEERNDGLPMVARQRALCDLFLIAEKLGLLSEPLDLLRAELAELAKTAHLEQLEAAIKALTA